MSVDVSQVVWNAGLSIEGVARAAGHDGAYVNRLFHGRLPVTATMARKLEAASGIANLAAMMLGFHPLPPSLDEAS